MCYSCRREEIGWDPASKVQGAEEKYKGQVTIRAYADDVNSVAIGRHFGWSQYLQDFAEKAAGVGMQIRISKSSLYSLRMDANDLITAETREVLDS